MNRITIRAFGILLFVLVLVAGTTFFLLEYISKASDWVQFEGSPYAYADGKVDTGLIADRTGLLLADLSGGKTYSGEEAVRRATLHWVGDREGNISDPIPATYMRQVLGHDLFNGVYSYGDAVGQLRLTLAADIQTVALEALGDRKGTVAVYNYQTGEILCAVTSPTYDPEQLPDIEGDTTGAYTGVYINRFLRAKYTPGSIFKIVTLAAALETVPDIRERTFTCTGAVTIGGGEVTCERAHGTQSLKEAFCNSCNCAFGEITGIVGRENMARYVELFGVNQTVSFDGYTTIAGNYDIASATAWEFAWSGIGQHTDEVNPCSFLTFMGAIAGDGIGAYPYVVGSVRVGGSQSYTAATQKTARLLSRETAQTIREYMQNNVVSKYGAENFPGLTVCAKSGTGEVGGDKRPNAMFAGFVADDKYPLAFIVAVEEGGYGANTCVPILSEVLEACKLLLDNS